MWLKGFQDLKPKTFNKAFENKESYKWLKVVNSKMHLLYKNQILELMILLDKQRVVSCKWIFIKNEGILRTEFPKYTEILVEKGFSKVKGILFRCGKTLFHKDPYGYYKSL